MRNFMAIALVMASLTSIAQAAPQEVNLNCSVISNGNGKNWEEVASLNKTLSTSEMFNELDLKVNSKFGEKFDVQVGVVFTSGSALLTVSTDIPGTNASILNQNRSDLEELDVNKNIVVTNSTFTLKKTAKKYVSYGITCIIT